MESVYRENVSRNIAAERVRLGMSREELATIIGKPAQVVEAWERGTGEPSLEDGVALSRVFGCSVDHLTERTVTRR